jgi:DNA-binding winged helix-turn-helix (wHTH) protein/Flp pilus assembly protein TadD/TolB-like protein
MQHETGISSTKHPRPPDDWRAVESRAGLVYEFGPFQLDPVNRLVTRLGAEVRLSGRAFDALLMLVKSPGTLLTKEELMDSVWDGSFVEESNLTVAMSTLRRALEEDPHARQYIHTVARQGYRFIADVRAKRPERTRTELLSSAEMQYTASGTTSGDHETNAPQAVDTNAVGAVQPEHAKKSWGREYLHSWPLLTLCVGLGVLLVAGGWKLLKPQAPIRTLAVLPFANAKIDKNGAVNQSGFDEVALLGTTDALIERLDSELEVRPTSSVLRYSNSVGADALDVMSIGKEQDVDAVLTGTLANISGERVRLQMRLYRVRDGLVLWQDTFEDASNNLPQIEQRVGQSVTHELHRLGAIATPPAETVTQTVHPDDPAYQLYLRGRYFWNRRTVEGLRKSTDYFRQSIDANPNYAPAYAGLADSYVLLASFSVEPGSSANADARSAALSAIHLDPTLAEPHASLGMIYFYNDWNLKAAEREFEQAIRLNPNYATAHHWYALDLAAEGRSVEALYEIHRAQKLDPLSLIIGTNLGWIEYLAHDYPSATRELHRVLEMDPNFSRARARLGMVEMATGDNNAAIADLTQALALSGDEDPWVAGLLGDAEARAGNRAAAEKGLAELGRRSGSRYVPPISRALILLGLGRKKDALVALGQAADDHSTSMAYARVDPSLDDLRDDPGFMALLARMKL